MGLPAFTNQPGSHTRNEWKSAREYGYNLYGSPQHYNNVVSSAYIELERCRKDVPMGTRPVRGKFHQGTNWSRAVTLLINDDPALYRRYITEGGDQPYVTVDSRSEYYTSFAHSIGSYRIPVRTEDMDNARNRAIAQALNKLQENYVNIGATLGEAHQIANQFAGAATRAMSVFRNIRHGNPTAAFRALLGTRGGRLRDIAGGVANNWLEFVYGWKPLAQDLYTTTQLLQPHLQTPVTVKGSSIGRVSNDVDFWYLDWLRHQGNVKHSFRAEFHGSVQNPAAYLLSSAGLTNPAAVAWELVPYSFVLDWFIPVGNVLQAITATAGLDFDGGWVSHQCEEQLAITHKVNFSGYGYGCIDGGNYLEKFFSFDRSCYASWPWPQFYANTTPWSTGRARNASALFTQHIAGH